MAYLYHPIHILYIQTSRGYISSELNWSSLIEICNYGLLYHMFHLTMHTFQRNTWTEFLKIIQRQIWPAEVWYRKIWAKFTKYDRWLSLPETGSLPSARWFAECCFSGTRQRRLCRQRKFQSTFWSSKLIQMKKFSTTKLYNSSRCTIFVLIFSSYDKVKINLFTNLTYLSSSLWNYKRDI